MYVLLHINTCTYNLKIFQRGTLLAHDDAVSSLGNLGMQFLMTMSQSGVYFTIKLVHKRGGYQVHHNLLSYPLEILTYLVFIFQ